MSTGRTWRSGTAAAAYVPASGEPVYLLTERSRWVDEGGKWGMPGGAIHNWAQTLPPRPLPRTVIPVPGEYYLDYISRLADANHLELPELTGALVLRIAGRGVAIPSRSP